MTDVFVNITGGIGTATYYVTPYYGTCIGDVKTIVVTIGSQPVLDPNLNMSICSENPTGLVLAVAPTSVAATTYNILSVNVQTGLVANAGNAVAANGIIDDHYLANDIFTNMTGADLTVTYRVQPVYGTTCIGDPVDVVVTIHPEPVILPGQVKTVCSNVPVNMEILQVPINFPVGTTFSWEFR